MQVSFWLDIYRAKSNFISFSEQSRGSFELLDVKDGYSEGEAS